MEINHYKQIEELLKNKTTEEKKEFCNQCLDEKNKYTIERLFALKEFLNNLQ